MNTSDKFRFLPKGIPFFKKKITNQKTFTLILTRSSDNTCGNGTVEKCEDSANI